MLKRSGVFQVVAKLEKDQLKETFKEYRAVFIVQQAGNS